MGSSLTAVAQAYMFVLIGGLCKLSPVIDVKPIDEYQFRAFCEPALTVLLRAAFIRLPSVSVILTAQHRMEPAYQG